MTSNSLPHFNGGIKFILVIICFLNKLVRLYPLKSKHAKAVAVAFREHFESHPEHIGSKIWTDYGTEFLGEVTAVLKRYGAQTYQTSNMVLKSSLAEASVKKIRGRIAHYLTSTGQKRYIDVLKKIETAINSEYHDSIGMRPIDVVDQETEARAWFNQFHRVVSAKRFKPKLKVGSLVRIIRSKLLFEKSYTQVWSSETFVIHAIISYYPIYVYKLKDMDGNDIPTKFYDFELQEIPKPLVVNSITNTNQTDFENIARDEDKVSKRAAPQTRSRTRAASAITT